MPSAENRTCHVIVIKDAWGISYELGLSISNFIEGFSPEYWAFVNPGTFSACFDDKSGGRERADRLKARFPILLEQVEEAKGLLIGCASGPMHVSVNDDGKWGMVVGKPISDASKNAERSPKA